QKVVLITGASAGLGLCLAKQLKDQNFHLVLTARESSLLRFKKNDIIEDKNTWLRPLDVTRKDQRELLISEINNKLGGVDILINNAGIIFRSVLEHITDEDRDIQMDVNFKSVMNLIRLVLPSMRAKRDGRIINVSSVGGMMAMPTMAAYSASKFALEGATEALYYEVKPWNIKVSLIAPGFINSGSFENTHYTKLSQTSLDNPTDPYHQHYTNMAPFIRRNMQLSPATQKGVATKIIKTIAKANPPLRIMATPDAVFFGFLRRIPPRWFYHWMLYRSLPGIKKWGK
ncbi:UNVERIFIED_CONTAM: hypothetical protein GTU68_031203, partial [Idotea baltica]|nr:hypothetical protein [Idotea baltica]